MNQFIILISVCFCLAVMNLFSILSFLWFLFLSIHSKTYLVQTLDDLEEKSPMNRAAYDKNVTIGDDYKYSGFDFRLTDDKLGIALFSLLI